MPELPEVETVRRGILPHLQGQVIQAVIVRNPKLRWPISPDLALSATGQIIHGISRRSKYIIWHLDMGHLIWHLGMTGTMRVLLEDLAPGKHDHVDVVLPDKTLRFNDPRRFGALFYTEDWQNHPLISALGPEPLAADFNAEYLVKKLKRTQRAIKLAIMDAHIVVGVGNIYASESLFLARIHPERVAASLNSEEIERLTLAIEATISKAIEFGGTTLKDFVQSDGKPGYFRNELQVYARKDLPCLVCTALIQKNVLGGRATYFCAHCQS